MNSTPAPDLRDVAMRPRELTTAADDLASATAALRTAIDAAETYRAMVQAALDVLHDLLVEHDRLRRANERALAELRAARRGLAT